MKAIRNMLVALGFAAALACGCAGPKEKRQFTGRCGHCQQTVVFTPYRVVITGSTSVTNRVRIDKSLLFKCPACKCKGQLQCEEWSSVNRARPHLPPPLPPTIQP